MSKRSAAKQRRELAAAIDAQEAARDEQLLLQAAWLAFNRGVSRPDVLSGPSEPAPAERLVVQNWKPEAGFIPLGDVQLELEPGQEVTLWVRGGARPELTHTPANDGAELDGLSILTDGDALLA